MLWQCKNRKKNLTRIALIAVAIGICAAAVCFAGNANTTTNQKNTSPIKDIPAVNLDGDRNFSKEVEQKYNFIGTIDEVQKDGIVVSDTYFKFAPDAQLSGVSVGASVGMILNKQREIVLCEPYKKVRR